MESLSGKIIEQGVCNDLATCKAQQKRIDTQTLRVDYFDSHYPLTSGQQDLVVQHNAP